MVTLLLSIGALRVSPRHRHRLTLSAPMPNTLIVCVIYVDFCTAPLRSSVTQVTQLLGIGALRVSPRHRHSLTRSAPMPNHPSLQT